MNKRKKKGRGVGILFLLGFAGGMATIFTNPLLNKSDYLTQISNNETQFLIGVSLLLVMAFSCAGIGMMMYESLAHYNISTAISVTGFRIMEGMLQLISACFLFLLIPISHQMMKGLDPSYYETFGNILNDGRAWLNNVYLLPWCIGAILYYYAFFKTKLIPNWLSIWGLISIFICFISTVCVFFNLIEPFSKVQIILNAPIALQEFVMAIWLILKGFNFSFLNNKKTV